MRDLLPCPFCGGEAIRVDVGLSEFVDGEVTCEDCGGNVGNYPTKADAIAAWNRRALPAVQPDALIAERDEALECNEQFFVDNQILRDRVEEIRKEWEGWQSAAVKLMEKVTALTVERDRFRVALQLYAEPCDATETSPCGYEGNMCCRTARAALKGESHE